MVDLKGEIMTELEIKETIRKRFKEACEAGLFAKFETVAREMGRDLNATYGPKYLWERGPVRLYVDKYGQYLTVTVHGTLVCSTHLTAQFICPGNWQDEILSEHEQAFSKWRARDDARRKELAAALEPRLNPVNI
jgi:hypothetical protein